MVRQHLADGLRSMAQSNYDSAVRHLEKAIALDPCCMDALMNLSIAYRRMCKFEESIIVIKKAIALKEEHYALNEILAATCMSIEDYSEAASAYKKALQGDYSPYEASALYARLALCYQKSGDTSSTSFALRHSLQLNKNTIHELYGYMLAELGWSPVIRQLEQEIEAEYDKKRKETATIFTDRLNNYVQAFNIKSSNRDLILNFISKFPSRLFLNIHNINRIEDYLLHKHSKLPAYFLSTGITVGSISGGMDYELVDNFVNSDFHLLSKLIAKKLNLLDTCLSDHVAYKSILDACNVYFKDLASSEFDSSLKGSDSLKQCILLLLHQGDHDLTNSNCIGLLTYYLMQGHLLWEILENDSCGNYLKSYIALLDLIEELYNEKSIDDFEEVLRRGQNISYIDVNDVDLMTGHEFEVLIGKMFEKSGYKVFYTKASGDQGVDIIAEKHGRKFGIQAKCYSKGVTNSAVQEIVAGIKHYNCDKGIVATNNYFTKSATELAESNDVVLWDRTILVQKLSELRLQS